MYSDSPDPAAEQTSQSSVVYITKAAAALELAKHGGMAMTPSGKEVTMTADDLCAGAHAHIKIPEGFKAVPNSTKDGFVLVPADADITNAVGSGGFKCSGCTSGCAPTASTGTIGCTAGCTSCSISN
jgi:hypothetical protein